MRGAHPWLMQALQVWYPRTRFDSGNARFIPAESYGLAFDSVL